MAKIKSVYFCNNCGYESAKWMGKCPACSLWDTFVEELIKKNSKTINTNSFAESKNRPISLSQVNIIEESRIDLLDQELNRVLGGGLVNGSLVLIGGEPGIGKSTIVLQTILKLKKLKTLYVSGEESVNQIKLRANRLGEEHDNILILCETNLDDIFTQIKNISPQLVIIDSIQTLYSDLLESTPGSISQIRECSASILKFSKQIGIPVILIGHINKEGSIAGPKVLEHIVDTVLQFEGDPNYMYRILRSIKNRFGSTSEIGIYEMNSDGLRQVSNPSEFLLSNINENLSGTSIAATIEGIRPFLIETQSLVSNAVYGNPQRSTTGFDIRRMNMLLAVLEKRLGFKLSQKDVFLNIAGGLKVKDPAIDLSVICSILSSSLDICIDKKTCLSGEIGLSGEIRPVNRVEQRIFESEKLGFSRILIPKSNSKEILHKGKIEIISVSRVEEAFTILFNN